MRPFLLTIAFLPAVACSTFEQPPVAPVNVDTTTLSMPAISDASYGSRPIATADAAAFGTIATPPRADDGIGKPYTILRLGAFDPLGDIDRGDTGFYGDVTFGQKILPFLGIEGSAGYFESKIIGDYKLWGIPLFVNARASLPVLILEPYIGAGIGGIYTEYPGNTDWVAAWNAFAGVGVGLGQLQLGLDYRYLQSEDTADNFAIEGQMVSAFASLPF